MKRWELTFSFSVFLKLRHLYNKKKRKKSQTISQSSEDCFLIDASISLNLTVSLCSDWYFQGDTTTQGFTQWYFPPVFQKVILVRSLFITFRFEVSNNTQTHLGTYLNSFVDQIQLYCQFTLKLNQPTCRVEGWRSGGPLLSQNEPELAQVGITLPSIPMVWIWHRLGPVLVYSVCHWRTSDHGMACLWLRSCKQEPTAQVLSFQVQYGLDECILLK